MNAEQKKKLIEVAMPLEAINKASVYEKMAGIGPHPRGLHVYWARRPLVTCRAVIFAQLVDDPSSDLEQFPTEKDQQRERERLFRIMEDLVQWKNSNNEEVLSRARAEIKKSCDGELPSIYDPFSGGGSIPLEAQRLGLPAYGSDLNPVAVMIGKAMAEIPPLFRDMNPVHPDEKERLSYKNAEGLAEDVKYYSEWMRERAVERIGHLYPKVDLPTEYGGGEATVIAWIWARTVPSPDPAFANVQVPIASSFLLSSKEDREAFIEPVIDRLSKTIKYRIINGGTPEQRAVAKTGTKAGRGAHFTCLFSGAAIEPDYVRSIANGAGLGTVLIAIVAKGRKGRFYSAPNAEHEAIARLANPTWVPDMDMNQDSKDLVSGRGYGFKKWHELFTRRQLVALTTFSDLVNEARQQIKKDALAAGMAGDRKMLRDAGVNARSYAEAISVYLSLTLGRLADCNNSLTRWLPGGEIIRPLFARQAIPMVWDFGEANILAKVIGGVSTIANFQAKCIETLPASFFASIGQQDASECSISTEHSDFN